MVAPTSQTSFDDVDFFKAGDLYQDPFPYFEYLRAHGPVWQEPRRGVFVVTGHDEALEVHHDTDTFSNANVVTGPFAKWPVPLEGDDVSELIEEHRDRIAFSDQLPSFDPPKHGEQRAILARLLTPKRLRENEAYMWTRSDRQIDEFVDRGRCEFIHEYANPFTFYVVADLLGVPEDQHEELRREVQGGSNRLDEDGAVNHDPLGYLYERFTTFVTERRREPRDDVMTAMATATLPDGTLPPVRDVMLLAANLFSAGGDTTARLLGHMFRRIGESPELQAELREHRDRLTSFIEECLRLEPPIQSIFRLARVPTTIGDVEVPAGATVQLLLAAANRDPRKFDDPSALRLDRQYGRLHLGFGSGVHACAGATLARAEARVSAERLLDRTADIRISEQEHGPPGARRYRYPSTYLLRGLNRLHLEFTPAT